MSLLRDIELIFATFFILFDSDSTTGVDLGNVTAMDYDSEK